MPTVIKNPWLLFLGVALGPFIVSLDFLVIGVAIEPMAKSLAVNIATLQWFVSAFALGNSSFLVTSGRLADLYGRKKVFIVGVFIFIISSTLIAISTSPFLIIIARLIQGVSAGIMNTSAIAVLMSLYDGEERIGWIGKLVGMSGLGMVLGPTVGGFLVHYFSWRMIFIINLPIGLIGLLLTLLYVPKQPPNKAGEKLDILGVILFTATLALFTTGISQGQIWGWSSVTTLTVFALSFLTLIIFLYAEHKCAYPLIEFPLFKIKNFFAANAVGFILYFASTGWIFAFGVYLQRVAGMTPQQNGLSLLPFSVMIPLLSIFIGKLSKRFSVKPLIVWGFLAGVIAFAGMSLLPIHQPYPLLALLFACFGICFILVNSCSMSGALQFMPPAKSGLASGKTLMMRWLGGALGAPVIAAVFMHVEAHRATAQAYHQALTVSMVILAILCFIALLTSQIWLQKKTA